MAAVNDVKQSLKRWILGTVVLVLAAMSARANPDWSKYNWTVMTVTVSGYQRNNNDNGLYVYTGNGYGANNIAFTHFPTYWWGTPFIQWEDGLGWVLENGVGGKAAFFGTGELPQTSTDAVVSVSSQFVNVSGTPGGNDAATKEPVNVINGGMFFNEADFGLAGAGFNLEWARTYNSALATTNGLGYCWSHNYDWSLVATTNTYINGSYTNSMPALKLTMGNGEAKMLLKKGGNNIWENMQTPPLTVTLTTSNEYALSLSAGYSCLFATNGLIKIMSNSWNNTLAFSYTNISGSACLKQVTHSDGRALLFTYSGNRIVRVDTPSTNLCYIYSYNGLGELTNALTRISSGDFATSYTYDTNGVHALVMHQNPLGQVATYAYATNALGQLLPKCMKVDVATNYYEHTIAYSGSVSTVAYARGNTNAVYRYFYNSDPSSMQITRIEGPSDSNNVECMYYDPLLKVMTNDTVSIRQGTSNVQWRSDYRYDEGGRLISFFPSYTSTSSPAWTYTWDTNVNLQKATTDPEGHRVEWDYTNTSVRATRVFPATNQPSETVYSYTPNGALATVTNANRSWTSFQNDSYGYPTQAISASGSTNWMTWNRLGHMTSIILPGSIPDTNNMPNMIPRIITFDPNELGWVKKITYPDSSFETFAFDALGNLTTHLDMAGRSNIYSWLPTRKLAATTRYLVAGGSNQAATIGLAYDQQMNTLNIKDELGRTVEAYILDLQDRPLSVTNLEGQVMFAAWGLGTLVQNMVRFDGTTNRFVYDESSRLSQSILPDDTISLTYFSNNFPRTLGNNRGAITNAYDGANRLVTQSQPVPAGSLSYGYYPAGQRSNVVSVVGTNTYTLDPGDRLQGLAAVSPCGRDSVLFSYDPASGMLSGASYSNGIHCSYSHDLMDRLTGITWADVSNQVLTSRAYTYTAAGLVGDITSESGEKTIYSYDSLDRLTRERHTDYYGQVISDNTYEYDLAGNRTRKRVLDKDGNTLVTINYSLPVGNKLGSWTVPETNLVTRFSVVGRSDDPIGVGSRYGKLWVSNSPSACFTPYVANNTNFYAFDLVSGMGTQYVYAAIRDLAGNTSYVTNRFYPTCLTNGTYQYSAAGCLTNRQNSGKDYTDSLSLAWNSQYQLTTATTNGTSAESYGYDGIGRRIFIVAGGATNWMVYDGFQVVAEVDNAGNLKKSYVYGASIDSPISMTSFGTTTNTYYFIKDHLGSTLALTDARGIIVESYRYDAWGRVLGIYDGGGTQIDESALGNRILWMGREYSARSSLYYFRARWYDPAIGKWISSDPIGVSGGVNQYVFCANNPVNKVDPFGLWAWDNDWVQMGVGGLAGFYGSDVASAWKNTEQGAYATLDGLIPFGDPFSGKYNPCDKTLQMSKNFGKVSQGMLLSAIPFRPFTASVQQVTHWGPPLQPGSWVMTGGPSIRNWVMSGAKYPAWKHEVTVIVDGALEYPSGWQWIKGLIGQRIYVP